MFDRLLELLANCVSKLPGGRKLVNRLAINFITNSTKARPYPFSLWSPVTIGASDKVAGGKVESARYTSWPGLVDRRFTGRHLPPAEKEYTLGLPPVKDVMPLFKREELIPCPRSSVLFCFFAQWFTDSFLRTDPVDRRKNTSNHEIDLCQIYGLKESTTDILRSHDDGKLRHKIINGHDLGEKLYDSPNNVKEHFKALPYLEILPGLLAKGGFPPSRLDDFYASGLERGNTTIVYSAISTVFRRAHNRLCQEFKNNYPTWDDDRLFQTARNVNITLLLKIIVEDYINHLSGQGFKIFVDVGFAEKQKWYRTNRIAIEFDLLYRWHGLVPDKFALDGPLDRMQFMYNNALVEQHGVEKIIKAASQQKAGKIGLNNTPAFLQEAEMATLNFARQFHVRSYNEYRSRFGQNPVQSFRELTGDAALAGKLERLYKRVDNVEFVVGLLAEKRSKTAVVGGLMSRMVGVDAFSHALTNPLLSNNIFGEDTFSEVGLRTIEETRTFEDIVKRNCGAFPADDVVASFSVVTET